MNFKTPVLFLIFNRPLLTQKVFAAIRQTRPTRLFVAADGPHESRPGEAGMCEQARRIVDSVDWDCQVSTLFRENNLGCKMAVSSAIDWFFSSVEEGIVLEDDCLPSPSFFPYCEALLARYRNDERVMQICGANFLSGPHNRYSYYFSQYGPVWGWASWRRAWEQNDTQMKIWLRFKSDGGLDNICLTSQEAEMRRELYDSLYRGEIDTWDYQWGFAKMINSGLSVTPAVNLISNIGFGAGATHTVGCESPFANLPAQLLQFPLEHPPYVCRDLNADRKYLADFVFAGQRGTQLRWHRNFWCRILGKT